MATSIILTHWSQNEFRSQMLRECLESLIVTTRHLPVEVIVVDNGQNLEDSKYLLGLAHEKRIQFYVRNSENLYFGHARNQGIGMSVGDYICVTDNDIGYLPGWLDKSLRILEAFPDKKIAVTPLRTDRQHRRVRYWREELDFEGEKILLNDRAGSNSWVMRRQDFLNVGQFRNHWIAGSKWTNDFVNKGYVMATMERHPLATDLAFKKGYNFKTKVVLRRIFANGEELVINN